VSSTRSISTCPPWAWLLLAGSGLACSSSSSDAPDAATAPGEPIPLMASGTRLRAQVLSSADGMQRFQRWFDDELGVPCSTHTAEDGQVRCLPETSWSTTYFADADCTERVAYLLACSEELTSYARVLPPPSDPPSCDSPTGFSVYEVGELRHGEVYVANGDTCDPLGDPGAVTHHLGARVDPESFAVVHRREVPSEERIGAVILEGEDGSHRVVGATDHSLGVPVSRALDTDAVRRWMPMPTTTVTGFSDDQCSELLATDFSGACSEPAELVARYGLSPIACVGSPMAIHELGPLLESPTRYVDGGGECIEGSSADATYYAVGPEVPADTFAPVESVLQGGSRLQVRTAVNPAGQALGMLPEYIDAEWDAPCSLLPAADGSIRCVPSPIFFAEGHFADDGCTTPVVSTGPLCTEPRVVTSTVLDGCDISYPTRVLGPIHEGPVFIALDDTCVEVDEVDEGLAFYTVGSELSPEEFVEVVTTTD
jgi:hypothetical protein